MKNLLTGIFLVTGLIASAQDSAIKKEANLTFSAFVEAYYGYDFNKPADNNRPAFIYSHNRHNEFNINLAYLKVAYNNEKTRASVALATGTYMNANYAAEPGVLRNIYEANAGAKISKKKNLWIDAGILPSHIGFESAHSPSCRTLTRSLIAENSPYFETGARMTYTTDSGRWVLSILALNGWQRIQRVASNSLMSWGTQLQFIPNANVTLNYSTFLGADQPDSLRRNRFFNNFYGIFQLSETVGLILDLDVGFEQKAKGSSSYNVWYGTAGILRFTPSTGWAIALRAESYVDERNVIIVTPPATSFRTIGASLNFDRYIGNHFLWRTEIKTLNNKDRIFYAGNDFKKNNTAITSSMALTF